MLGEQIEEKTFDRIMKLAAGGDKAEEVYREGEQTQGLEDAFAELNRYVQMVKDIGTEGAKEVPDGVYSIRVGTKPGVFIMLRMPDAAIPALLLGLLGGTLSLSLLGTAAAALVLGARRGGVLMPLLILPLAAPVLIFGTAAADAASADLSPRPHLLLLAAFLAFTLPTSLAAAAAGMRGPSA